MPATIPADQGACLCLAVFIQVFTRTCIQILSAPTEFQPRFHQGDREEATTQLREGRGPGVVPFQERSWCQDLSRILPPALLGKPVGIASTKINYKHGWGRSLTLSERMHLARHPAGLSNCCCCFHSILMTTLGNGWFSCFYFYILRMGKLSS